MSRAVRLAKLACAFSVRALAVLALSACLGSVSLAHEVRPAYLDLKEEAPGSFDVLFKTPMVGDLRLALSVSFSGQVQALTPVLSRTTGDALVQTWRIRASEGLAGQDVRIVGLENTVSDALLRVEFARRTVLGPAPDARRAAATVPGGNRAVPASPPPTSGWASSTSCSDTTTSSSCSASSCSQRHCASSPAPSRRSPPRTASRWRPRRSGLVHVPPKPVEAVIALSIAFLAVEIVRARSGKAGIAARAPWIVAFAFGLLHGFGFAGALSEIGMPAGHIPVALFFFNLGVEAGQLLFVAAVMALAAAVRFARLPLPPWATLVPPYLIGSLAMAWVVQRVFAF